MKARCLNPRNHNFKNYGGRGITVCDAWLTSFDAFLADMGLKPDGLTLERINNAGNYEPTNCRWASRAEQRRNQRNCMKLEVNGVPKTAEEWARETGLNAETIRRRKRAGYTDAQALYSPRLTSNQFIAARAQAGKEAS